MEKQMKNNETFCQLFQAKKLSDVTKLHTKHLRELYTELNLMLAPLSNQPIKVDVNGEEFKISKQTLDKYPDSKFYSAYQAAIAKRKPFSIDMDLVIARHVFNYLRSDRQ